MEDAGLQEVESYVSHRQNTVAKFIATKPIIDLCLAAEWRSGPRVFKRWWEQGDLGVEGIRTAAW